MNTTLRGVLLAAAVVGGFGCGANMSECTIGDERCKQKANELMAEHCVQNPYGNKGDGFWLPKDVCEVREVCLVDLDGFASCVTP